MISGIPSPSVFLAIFFLLGCSDKIEPGTTKKSPPNVHRTAVSVARIIDQPFNYEAVATVQAGFSANLSSKLVARVEEIRVREGARVKKGEKLVTNGLKKMVEFLGGSVPETKDRE